MEGINEAYKKELATVKGMIEDGVAVLADILTPTQYAKAVKHLIQAPNNRIIVPDEYQYTEITVTDELQETVNLIKQFIEITTNKEYETLDLRARIFGVGDFTLQHVEQPPNGLHIALFIPLNDWKESFRGELTYVPEEGRPLIINPEINRLSIVHKSKTTTTFIKKITYYAIGERYGLIDFVLH